MWADKALFVRVFDHKVYRAEPLAFVGSPQLSSAAIMSEQDSLEEGGVYQTSLKLALGARFA